MDVNLCIMSWISGQKQISHSVDAVKGISKNIVHSEKKGIFVLYIRIPSYIQEIHNHSFIYLFI